MIELFLEQNFLIWKVYYIKNNNNYYKKVRISSESESTTCHDIKLWDNLKKSSCRIQTYLEAFSHISIMSAQLSVVLVSAVASSTSESICQELPNFIFSRSVAAGESEDVNRAMSSCKVTVMALATSYLTGCALIITRASIHLYNLYMHLLIYSSFHSCIRIFLDMLSAYRSINGQIDGSLFKCIYLTIYAPTCSLSFLFFSFIPLLCSIF